MTAVRSEHVPVLRAVPAWLWLFAAAWIALAVYWQWLVHRDGILGDMWDMLPGYRQLPEMGLPALWDELVSQYARVHVLAVPKLLFWLNFAFFAGSGALLKAVSFACCLGIAGLLVSMAARQQASPGIPMLVVLALLTLFNGLQVLVIDWDFLVQHYLAVLFSLLAFCVYDRWRCLPIVFACVLLACFSCGSGWATLATTGFLFWSRREPWPVLAAYGLFALVVAWIIWPEPQLLPAGIGNASGQPFFWSAPRLLLQYLSYPFGDLGVGWWPAGLLLLLCMQMLFRCLRRDHVSVVDVVGCYFFLVACTVVLGRYRFLDASADLSRFYVYVAPLWFLLAVQLVAAGRRWLTWLALALCASLSLAGVAAVVVAADHAGRMDMARVVVLNGNTAHLAGLRLNAMRPAGSNPFRDDIAYLRDHGLDVFRHAYTSLSVAAGSEAVCHAVLLRKATVSQGRFTDYFFREVAGSGSSPVVGFYAVDGQKNVRFHGAAVAAANRQKGWQIRLDDVRGNDWPLLLPLPWLALDDRVLYTHLPATVDPAALEWWAQGSRGDWCRFLIGN